MVANELKKRTDRVSKFIYASPERIYEAFINEDAVKIWRHPAEAKCLIYEFEPKPNGAYRICLSYLSSNHHIAGRTTANEDVVKGCFVALVPYKRIVELVEFETNDPLCSGPMTVTTMLEPLKDGTQVTLVVDNVPPGIEKEHHHKAMESALNNLAAYVT